MDDKKFSSEKRKSWNESDSKEWSQWTKNGSVRILVFSGGAKNSKDSNHCSTNAVCSNLEVKWWGDATKEHHHNPWTLGPTIWKVSNRRSEPHSGYAVQVAVTFAASLGMFGETLVGSAAFLSGLPLGSPIHVKSSERWCTGSW